MEHSPLRGCHEPETAIRKQTSLIEHGAVNLVTKHPQDSPHPRHGVPEALPTQRRSIQSPEITAESPTHFPEDP